MSRNKRKESQYIIGGISAGVAVVLLIAGFFIVKLLISEDGQKRKRQIKMVTMVKPPPPPKVQEKPPEPEKKKEEMIEPEPEEQPPEEMAESDDGPPPGEDLGLDSDGTAGSDGFGLKAKKGGRPLIGGGYGTSKYGWYTNLLTNEIQRLVNRLIQKNGGIPDDSFESLVRLVLDDEGGVVEFSLVNSSGNDHVDEAIREALVVATISEPPPIGMPKRLRVLISPGG